MEVTKASGIPVAKRGLVARDARVSSPFPCVTDDRRENKKELSPPKTNQRLLGDPEIVHQAVENNVRQWLLNSGQGLGFADMTTSATRMAPPPPPARSVTLQQSSRVSCAPSVVSSPGGRESAKSSALRPHAMRKTLSDNSGDFRGSGADGRYLETRFSYSVQGALGSAAQASAAAAFFARATQKMNLSSPNRRMKRQGSEDDVNPMEHSFNTNFYGLLRRSPPPAPTNLLRRLAARENPGVGKVKVMLRISGSNDHPSQNIDFLTVDKRRKQIALQEPNPAGLGIENPAAQERRIGIAAPKMFAFDGLFTHEDSQADVATSVLSDIIAAVINGSDGCVFTFGDSSSSKTYTALGDFDSGSSLGLIPTAIAWLFRGITEQKVKTGARFSVRVSAVEVSGPNEVLRDLLASHATESEQSPGVYLRDDPLLGTQLQNQSELRAPSLEKAAFYLDAALSARSDVDQRFSHLLYTLHVYQYSLDKSGRGGVAGGRSRLHLLDLGTSRPSTAGSASGLSLSALSSILVALFNGQRHLPHRDRKVTQLLRECLSSLTCQAALVAHISADSLYSEALTTAQMASRVHRMRRRRLKNFGGPGTTGEDSRMTRSSGEESSASADPSSSEQSCDTVIYMGPMDDATDGEHPPVYLPSLNSGDNRCSMSKALRGSTAEDSDGSRKSRMSTPVKESKIPKMSKPPISAKSPQVQRKSGLKIAESSPMRTGGQSSSDEQWIDGPRLHKSRVPEVRSIVRANQVETWIDGPSALTKTSAGYGFMDDHKRGMIRHWVETQTAQGTNRFLVPDPASQTSGAANQIKVLTVFKTCDEAEPEQEPVSKIPAVPPKPRTTPNKPPLLPKPSEKVIELRRKEKQLEKEDTQEASLEELCFQCDELVESLKDIPDISTRCETIPEADSEDERASSRRSTHEDYNQEFIEVEEPSEPVPTQDSCLQVTEEDIVMSIIALDGGGADSSDQSSCGGEEHPLRVLSEENLTIVSHFTGETYSQGTASEWEYTNVAETGNSADDSVFFKSHLEHLTRLQQIYEPSGGLLHPPSLTSVAPHITSFKDLPLCTDWNIPSPEPIRKMAQDSPQRSAVPIASMSRSLENNLEPVASIPRALSSLRHPDGASNPQLNQHPCTGSIYECLEKRLPGNGASKSDSEQENSRISLDATILERIPAGKSDSEMEEGLNHKKPSAKTPKLGRIFRGSSKKSSPASHSPKNDKRSSSKCRDVKNNSPSKSVILSPKLKNANPVAHKSPKRDSIKFNSKREVKSYGFSYESCHQVASSSLCPSEGYESGGSDSAVSPYLSPAKGRRHPVPGFQNNRRPGKHFSSNTGTGGSGGSGGHYASSGYESVLRDSECSSLGSSQDSDRETRTDYGKSAIINGQSSSCSIL